MLPTLETAHFAAVKQTKHFSILTEKLAIHDCIRPAGAADLAISSNGANTMSMLTPELTESGARKILTASLTATYRAFRSYRARRLAMLSLAQMDDYLLKDIGITRSGIDSAVVHGSRSDRETRP